MYLHIHIYTHVCKADYRNGIHTLVVCIVGWEPDVTVPCSPYLQFIMLNCSNREEG